MLLFRLLIRFFLTLSFPWVVSRFKSSPLDIRQAHYQIAGSLRGWVWAEIGTVLNMSVPKMVFVTVGTYKFDELVKTVAKSEFQEVGWNYRLYRY